MSRKSVELQRSVEFYCHCPYCEALNENLEDNIALGGKIKCASCGKSIIVKEGTL